MGAIAVAEPGGIDGTSFGAGWGAAATLFTAIGAFLWRVIGKAKAAQVKTLMHRITHLERDLDEERALCRRDIQSLNDQIRVLEAMTLGSVRQQAQAAISEINTEMRTIDRDSGDR